ncbi:MAG TPA: hypothetical protein VNB06_19610 [Thermoanaerobaculia bacterium]|nr:hypothetical protein [Thermoanaerobaculia bacterium]
MNRRDPVISLLVASICLAAGSSFARQLATPAGSPTEIRPLLIGSEVPSAEVRSVDGQAADLREIVLGKPTLLLFYRGGW